VVRIHNNAIGRESQDHEHPMTAASSINNLAELHGDQGKYESALPLIQRALASTEKTFGSNHKDIELVSINYLAVLYVAMAN